MTYAEIAHKMYECALLDVFRVSYQQIHSGINLIGGVIVANIKSAKKRILVINTKTERNKAIRSKVKTYVKKVYQAIESGDKAAAGEALRAATSELNRAGSKGIYHKNTVSRKISRLSAAVNKMA